MKNKLLLLIAVLAIAVADATAAFFVDNISYVISNQDFVWISGHKSIDYMVDVVIPPTVSYQGYTYEVREIEYNSLSGWKNILSVSIPATVEKLNDGAFNGCSNLEKVEIKGQNLKIINQWAFANTAITEITIPASVTKFEGNTFNGCKKLKKINLGSGITEIPFAMCKGCESLTSIEISEDIIKIHDYAFSGCDIREVEIPSGLTYFGWSVYQGNYNITKVTSHILEPMSIDSKNFEQTVYENATLYVPKGTIELYRKRDGWKNFLNIMEIPSAPGDVNSDGVVTMSDANEVVNTFLTGGYSKEADMNDDGEITMADANEVVNKFLSSE
jgi:hypothetical protein